MRSAFLVLPSQLFHSVSKLSPQETEIIFYEADAFFTKKPFHKQKLVLHRASMQALRERLLVKGFTVQSIEAIDRLSFVNVFLGLMQKGYSAVSLYEVVDHILTEEIEGAAAEVGISVQWHASPAFSLSSDQALPLFREKKTFHDFYTWQRRRMRVLIDGAGQPVGGAYYLGRSVLERAPSDYRAPKRTRLESDRYLEEAFQYVETHFGNNPGSLEDYQFAYTYDDALEALEAFIAHILPSYDITQDAVSEHSPYMHHSVLSAAMAVGLLTPADIWKNVTIHRHYLPDAAVEAYYRAVFGTREWMRIQYLAKPDIPALVPHTSLPDYVVRGETGLEPLDTALQRASKHAYLSAMERALVYSGLVLLGLSQEAIYTWFCGATADVADWALLTNIAEQQGVLFDASFIMKISDYAHGDWAEVWDALVLTALERGLPADEVLYLRFMSMGDERKVHLREIARLYRQTLLR